jgi:hypothetical protein
LGHWIDLNDWARTFSAHGAADFEFSLPQQTTVFSCHEKAEKYIVAYFGFI